MQWRWQQWQQRKMLQQKRSRMHIEYRLRPNVLFILGRPLSANCSNSVLTLGGNTCRTMYVLRRPRDQWSLELITFASSCRRDARIFVLKCWHLACQLGCEPMFRVQSATQTVKWRGKFGHFSNMPDRATTMMRRMTTCNDLLMQWSLNAMIS